jgi:hypothetical protein
MLAYWGEEGQRQRVRWFFYFYIYFFNFKFFRWEKAYKPFYLNGFRFSGIFTNEKEFTAEQKRKALQSVKEEDAKEFLNLLRIIKFNVRFIKLLVKHWRKGKKMSIFNLQ